jgi:hypothetical protein
MAVLDRDERTDDEVLSQSSSWGEANVRIEFLLRKELEDYFLDPEFVTAAVQSAATSNGVTAPEPDKVRTSLGNQRRLHPDAKGSAILSRVFNEFSLRFDKVAFAEVVVQGLDAMQSESAQAIKHEVRDKVAAGLLAQTVPNK